MARSRNIKPDLFKNELLGDADPLLTILFTGLWCLADREGKLLDRPKRIKAEIFPYRDLPCINGYLTELQRLGFIDRYSVGNLAIIKVLEFNKHQSPHKTEKASELPEKPRDSTVTCKAPLNNGTITDEAALIPDSLIPDSLNKTAPEINSDAKYFFTGNKFNITHKDFKKHQELYQNLNLFDEYTQLDSELRDTTPKRLWGELSAKLNYRNKVCKPVNHGFGKPRLSSVEQATQHNAEYARQLQEQIEREASFDHDEALAVIDPRARKSV